MSRDGAWTTKETNWYGRAGGRWDVVDAETGEVMVAGVREVYATEIAEAHNAGGAGEIERLKEALRADHRKLETLAAMDRSIGSEANTLESAILRHGKP